MKTPAKQAPYYAQSNNRKFDAAILDKAKELTAGQGDGRISKDDAAELAETVNDGGVRTDIESATVRKVKRDHKFTPAGADEFERLNRVAGQERRHAAAPSVDQPPGAGQASMLQMRADQSE